ncbi:hypothetical protein [Ichthyenterobacterium magnum]|uniref:Polyketide cyclase/dehydrase/lipid transport protein n=1 Tax=Ichthyenterobacterium magnum TaxID=1230530 RepID=A0A420DKL1_9FLAO|nr:hypothetical protein [Ichthyenterobacterium magnum]RKE94749.1 hypothetical protein BXY80_1761 [Ichthyenterobacterium magnum]
MKVINVHKRIINQPKAQVVELLKTLATKDDKIWPREYWPAMQFKNGLAIGSKGGHGIIRYSVETKEKDFVKFKFSKPKGFVGCHQFEIKALIQNKTEITHTINMNAIGFDVLKWVFVIRWLHDALAEDALDKAENYFSGGNKRTQWSIWVRLWRFIFKTFR